MSMTTLGVICGGVWVTLMVFTGLRKDLKGTTRNVKCRLSVSTSVDVLTPMSMWNVSDTTRVVETFLKRHILKPFLSGKVFFFFSVITHLLQHKKFFLDTD